MRCLLDTHIWVWSLTNPQQLSRRVHTVLANARTEGWLSPISAWEAVALAERGRLGFKQDARQWVRNAVAGTPLKEAPLVYEVALRSREVRLPHDDPADRFLVATALVYDLTFVTADEKILRAKPCALLPNV